MADGRMLKKKVSLNESLANLENDTHRLLFTWAIPHLDIEGRITGSPRVFKASVAPLLDHLTSDKINKFFADAHGKGLIFRYKVDGVWWIEFPKFKENQNLRESREAPSLIPPPPDLSTISPGDVQDMSVSSPPRARALEVKGREVNINICDKDFESWWKEYPTRRKVGKPEALKKWQQLMKSGELPSLENMLTVLRMQKDSMDWKKEGGQYIPGPTPYLNKGKYIDESLLPEGKQGMDLYIDRLVEKERTKP